MHNPREPVFVLLAAGKSRRFGSNKLSARLANDKTVLQQSCDNILAVSSTILAVVNSSVPSTENALQRTVINCLSLPSAGMGQSIAAAVQHSPSNVGWVLCLADMPFIQPQTLSALHREITRYPDNIIRLRHAHTPGHPVYFPNRFYSELRDLDGDVGAREILLRYAGELRWLDVEDSGILRDIDKQEDLPGYTPC